MESPKTITYNTVGPLEVKLDLYIPKGLRQGSRPAVLYFHGGGFVTANRQGLLFQKWLIEALAKNGIPFISCDYRLLYPSTGFSIIDDVKAAFSFVASPSFSTTHLPSGTTLDATRLACACESSGGYPGIAAALYATPKPRALLLQYIAGGDLLTNHYLEPKPDGAPTPDDGKAIIPREAIAKFLDGDQTELSDDYVGFLSGKPEEGDSGRTALSIYWLGQGNILDHITGKPGLSAHLLAVGAASEEREKAVPEDAKPAILQCNLTKDFPPTFSYHGREDRYFLAKESETLHKRLQGLGVRSDLHIVPGGGHGLVDIAKKPELVMVEGTDEIHDKAAEWLLNELK